MAETSLNPVARTKELRSRVSRGEVLACRCRRDDLAVLRRACESDGPKVCIVNRPVELARQAVAKPPVAIVLGVGSHTRSRLEVIPIIRAVWKDLPVIVIAEEDSLELQKRARQVGIFYYFVHPREGAEVEAVLNDVLRRAEGQASTKGVVP